MFSKRKATPTHPIDVLRKGDAIFNHALEKIKQFQIAQQTLEASLPSTIGQYCRVITIENGELTLMVPNSAVAAKIRQLAPSICSELNTHGYSIHKMKLKIVMPTQQYTITQRPTSLPITNQKERCHDALRDLLKMSGKGALSDTIQKILNKA